MPKLLSAMVCVAVEISIVALICQTEYVSSLIFKTVNRRRSRNIDRDPGEARWLLSNAQF